MIPLSWKTTDAISTNNNIKKIRCYLPVERNVSCAIKRGYMVTAIQTMYATRLDIYIYFLKYVILVQMKPKDVFGVNYKN